MITVIIIKSIDLSLIPSLIGGVLTPFVTFVICMFLTRFYMIWTANSYDKSFTFMTIFLSCLKFWDSTLLIKSYFGSTSQDELLRRIDDKRE